MNLSILIPLLNEEESLKEFIPGLLRYATNNYYEIIFLDDGSTDDSWSIIDNAC
jgi:glycosyltransferase involved in cell wall biosynthesis